MQKIPNKATGKKWQEINIYQELPENQNLRHTLYIFWLFEVHTNPVGLIGFMILNNI